jgi:hypothetical protein
VTVAEVTADHHDSIRVIGESLGNHSGVNPACAHDSDDANIRRILNPGNSSEISRCVPSPGAAENQDSGSEI